MLLAAAQAQASEVTLTPAQQQTILAEAGADYTQASDLAATDAAAAKQLFESAAGKYQLLVDAGIHNSRLYLNLGNAYLQYGELGRAIANYERARRLDPSNRQLLANLQFAKGKVEDAAATDHAAASGTPAAPSWWLQHARSANDFVVETVGMSAVIGCLVLASLAFWGLWIVRVAGVRFHVWRFAAAPLLILLVSLGSYGLACTGHTDEGNAVVVTDHLRLHAGDGLQFAEVAALDEAQGRRIEVLSRRGPWTQVRTTRGQTGWVQDKDIEQIGV